MSKTKFGAAVKTAFESVPAIARFGRKVTISGLFAEYDGPESLGEFKARLLEAHRAGEVVLSRLDLNGIFPAAVVERSKVEYMGVAEFHMVEM